MSVVGIIAEFNPFHNGHKYIIEQAKEMTGADTVVVIMSGNYVQRGTPAICDKFTRTKMAVDNGCDLVIELPLIYSCGSAKYFAEGAVNLLNQLGCIDYLAFGAEYSNIDFLNGIADILSLEPVYYRERLNHYIKNGYSFPFSRENAVYDYMLLNDSNFDESAFREVMSSPNCILAIEYMCALRKFNSFIKPFPITRIMAAYHQLSIQEDICSASALRNIMNDFDNLSQARNAIPESVFSIFKQEYGKSFPVYEDDFSYILANSLIVHKHEYQKIYDFSVNFSNRVKNLSENFSSFSQFSQNLLTKNVTSTYVNRCLTHLMLNISSKMVKDQMKNGYNFYVRILGFNKNSSDILTDIKTYSALPIITKISDSYDSLSYEGRQMLDINIKADELYRYVQNIKFNNNVQNEYRKGIYMKRS